MNARLLFIIYLFIGVLPGFSQDSYPDEAFATPESVRELLTALGAGKQDNLSYKECSVDYPTGAANISFPLLSIGTKDVELNIGLGYNTSGLRANQKAGYLGLGWTLTGLPRITRQITGSMNALVMPIADLSADDVSKLLGKRALSDIFHYDLT